MDIIAFSFHNPSVYYYYNRGNYLVKESLATQLVPLS